MAQDVIRAGWFFNPQWLEFHEVWHAQWTDQLPRFDWHPSSAQSHSQFHFVPPQLFEHCPVHLDQLSSWIQWNLPQGHPYTLLSPFIAITYPPNWGGVGWVSILKELCFTFPLGCNILPQHFRIQCLFFGECIREVPKVNRWDYLLQWHLHQQPPYRLLFNLCPNVPKGIDDGSHSQVDSSFLGSDPTQLTLICQRMPERPKISANLHQRPSQHSMPAVKVRGLVLQIPQSQFPVPQWMSGRVPEPSAPVQRWRRTQQRNLGFCAWHPDKSEVGKRTSRTEAFVTTFTGVTTDCAADSVRPGPDMLSRLRPLSRIVSEVRTLSASVLCPPTASR